MLLVLGLTPVNEELFFNWAVAGIDPSQDGLIEGKLRDGAVVGENGFGDNEYSICPDSGVEETYFFSLYALPKAISAEEGFDPLALREEALDTSGNVGLLAATYKRQ